MKVTELIETLGSFEPDGYPFLSIYINAEPGQNGRDTFPIWLKGELSATREYLQSVIEQQDSISKILQTAVNLGDQHPDYKRSAISILSK